MRLLITVLLLLILLPLAFAADLTPSESATTTNPEINKNIETQTQLSQINTKLSQINETMETREHALELAKDLLMLQQKQLDQQRSATAVICIIINLCSIGVAAGLYLHFKSKGLV